MVSAAPPIRRPRSTEPGDSTLAIDGQPVDASTDLPPGQTVQLHYKARFSTPRAGRSSLAVPKP